MNTLKNTLGSIFLFAGIAQADQVILDDLIVDGSNCVGQDCVNGESFGFDTIRIKENNLRINFDDTSTAASFPRNDWRITVNDSANGGGSYFSIDDATAGRQVFRVDAGAPANALRVDSGGDVGIGTANPVVDLHIKSGNTPTTRLEQDGSSGFTPQTWDVAGNEANFFIRDATNGSTLPFKIFPGAPTNSLTIEASGDIGIGTQSPTDALHVRRTNGTASVFVEEASTTPSARTLVKLANMGNPELEFANTSNDNNWVMSGGIKFVIKHNNNAGTAENRVLSIDSTGALIIAGSLTETGTPDYVFENDYELMPLDDLQNFISVNKHLPSVPSASNIAKNGLNMTELQFKLLEKVEELTLYTLRQELAIRGLKAKMEQQKNDGG